MLTVQNKSPPHLHLVSRYVTACDELYQAFALQATNTGAQRLASDKHWGEKACKAARVQG